MGHIEVVGVVVWALWCGPAFASDPAVGEDEVVAFEAPDPAAAIPGLSTAAVRFEPATRKEEKALKARIAAPNPPATSDGLRELAAMCWAQGTENLSDAKKLRGWGQVAGGVVAGAALTGGIATALDAFAPDDAERKPSAIVVPIGALATTVFGGAAGILGKSRADQTDAAARQLLAAEAAYSWAGQHPGSDAADVRTKGLELRLECTGVKPR